MFTNQPIAMNDYKTVKIYEYTQGCFNLLDELRYFMDAGAVEIGYIAPSHGSKSKKVWLCNDSDLKVMFNAHSKKKVINLWCYTEKKCSRGKKKSRSPCDEKASMYQKIGTSWHESYEEPPDKIQCTKCSEHNNTLE